MSSMKAIVARSVGTLDGVALAEVPQPQPRPDRLLVRVEAAGINPADWKVVLRGMPGWSLPQVLGLDGVGTVADAGDGSHGFTPGDRVWFHHGLTRLGAFADLVSVEPLLVSHAPRTLSAEQAAAVPTPGFTAWQVLLDRLRFDGVRTALVLGGSGAVAAFFIQGLVARGIEVTATASAGRESVPRALGASKVVPMAAAASLPADLVVETAGTDAAITAALAACTYGGQLALCNGWRPMPPATDWPRGLTVHDVFLGAAVDQSDACQRARIGAIGAALSREIDAGRVRVPQGTVVAPAEVPDLLRRMAAGAAPGKFVVHW